MPSVTAVTFLTLAVLLLILMGVIWSILKREKTPAIKRLEVLSSSLQASAVFIAIATFAVQYVFQNASEKRQIEQNTLESLFDYAIQWTSRA
jgi:H+/gluconate symporter-like permease